MPQSRYERSFPPLSIQYKFNVREQRSSALRWGVLKRNPEFVRMMLHNYQADANVADDNCRTPVFQAVRAENETIIRMLLTDGRTDINWEDRHQQTPLVYAIRRNCLAAASTILGFEPCPDKTDYKKRSAVWYTIARRDENLVRTLLRRGSDIRTPEYKGFSPIRLAIAKRDAKIARMLLHHSDPSTGMSLLEDVVARGDLIRWAVKARLQDIILLLITNGANPNTCNTRGQSLLHLAVETCGGEAIGRLLTYEAVAVNTRGRYGRTAFQMAAEYGYRSLTRLLLASAALDINAVDTKGATALVLAVQGGHTAVAMQILAENHVDVNAADQDGRTALHFAVRAGNIPIVSVLLDKDNIGPNVCDIDEWVPFALAAEGAICLWWNCFSQEETYD